MPDESSAVGELIETVSHPFLKVIREDAKIEKDIEPVTDMRGQNMSVVLKDCVYDGIVIWATPENEQEFMADVNSVLPTRFHPIEKLPVPKEKYRNMKNRCFLINDEQWLRGVDIKLDEDYKNNNPAYSGLCLLMLSQVSCKRNYDQALGRVGRYNEKCTRYQFAEPSIEPHDGGKSYLAMQALIN